MDKLQKLLKDMDPSNSNLLRKMADDLTDNDPFLHFLFLSILKRPTTESVFCSLDARIVEYIIYEKFNISMKIEQRPHECKNPGLLLETLLLLEKEIKDLYHVAPDYIQKLVADCSRTFLKTVVSENIVSGINNQIYANLDLTTDCLANDYKIFTQSCNYDYNKRFEILSNSNINIKRLFKYSLKNSEELTRELMVTYPELNYHRPYIVKNRNEIFIGLETPASKKSKMCYSFAMKIHIHRLLKTDTNTLDQDIIKYNKHLDALYKLIIIENSELTQHFCLDVLNQILDDNILVAELMVRRKFNNIYIDTIVEYVPLFAYVFQLSVNLYNSTQDKFYELLANKLYKKHRIGNIKELLNITKP